MSLGSFNPSLTINSLSNLLQGCINFMNMYISLDDTVSDVSGLGEDSRYSYLLSTLRTNFYDIRESTGNDCGPNSLVGDSTSIKLYQTSPQTGVSSLFLVFFGGGGSAIQLSSRASVKRLVLLPKETSIRTRKKILHC